MRTFFFLIAFSSFQMSLVAQNVGIKNTNPQAALDVNGDIILRTGSLTLVNGQNNDINTASAKFSFYSITGPTTVFNISGLNGGVDGRVITLYNSTSFLMVLQHQQLSVAANQIHTGTGVDFSLSSYSAVTFRYMSTDNKWHISSSHNQWNPITNPNNSGWASSNYANGDGTYKATFPDVGNRIVFINSPVMSTGGYLSVYRSGGLHIINPSNGVSANFITVDGQTIQAKYKDDNAVNPYEDEYESNLLLNRFGGNVGIGTADPGAYKLAVNGTIRAKEIRVNTGWADYVFEKDYKLATLSEIEQFIIKHQHLPGIASATELKKEGVDISAMQTKMMEKIEELTLYIIAINKRIQELEVLSKTSIKK